MNKELVRRIIAGWLRLEAECEYRHIPHYRMSAMVAREVALWARRNRKEQP